MKIRSQVIRHKLMFVPQLIGGVKMPTKSEVCKNCDPECPEGNKIFCKKWNEAEED